MRMNVYFHFESRTRWRSSSPCRMWWWRRIVKKETLFSVLFFHSSQLFTIFSFRFKYLENMLLRTFRFPFHSAIYCDLKADSCIVTLHVSGLLMAVIRLSIPDLNTMVIRSSIIHFGNMFYIFQWLPWCNDLMGANRKTSNSSRDQTLSSSTQETFLEFDVADCILRKPSCDFIFFWDIEMIASFQSVVVLFDHDQQNLDHYLLEMNDQTSEPNFCQKSQFIKLL